MPSRTLLVALLSLLLPAAATAEDGSAVLAKAVAFKGDVAKLNTFKTYEATGSLKHYFGSNYQKYDFWNSLQRPGLYADQYEGVHGTTSGSVVRGGRGMAYSRDAVRTLAKHEVKSRLADFEDLAFFWRLKEGKEALAYKGAETIEVIDLDEKEKRACAKFEKAEDKNRTVYYFDSETGELVRRFRRTVDRTGVETVSYVDYLEYEDFDGVQVALTQNVYEETEDERGKKSFKQVRKVSIDEVLFDEEVEEGTFDLPKHPFPSSLTVADLSAKAAKAFQGRDPNLAELAQMALVSRATEVLAKLKEWKSSETAALRHYANIVLIRSGRSNDADSAYRAQTFKTALGGGPSLDLTLKAVGHAGFCVLARDKVVFLDAPYQPGLFGNVEPSLTARTISKADILLFSSARATCFDPAEAAAVVRKTGARVVGPWTVKALLEKEGVAGEKLVEITPAQGKTATIEVEGLKITALRTESRKAVHLAYVLDWGGGCKTLHMGSTLKYEKVDFPEAKGASLGFLPLFAMNTKSGEFLGRLGTVPYLVPTHFAETPGTFRQLRDKRDEKAFAKLVVLYPGEQLKF